MTIRECASPPKPPKKTSWTLVDVLVRPKKA